MDRSLGHSEVETALSGARTERGQGAVDGAGKRGRFYGRRASLEARARADLGSREPAPGPSRDGPGRATQRAQGRSARGHTRPGGLALFARPGR